MASYFQTTIHSKNSKLEKNNVNGLGRLYKGSTSASKNNRNLFADVKQYKHFSSIFDEDDDAKDVQGEDLLLVDNQSHENTNNNNNNSQRSKIRDMIEKSKDNPKKAMQFNKSKGILAGQSDIFPAIFFKKTTMRNILKQFVFPKNCKALPPNDNRSPLIFQIVGNLFNEINFYIFNLLIGENKLSKSYYVFFSDSESMPFTKCCNTPAYVQLHSNSTGRILCNSENCLHPSLAEFLIGYQDSLKLWPDITYLQQAKDIDIGMKAQICKYIKTGKYRNRKLQSLINDTSRRVQSFYETSNIQHKNQTNNQFSETPFLTDLNKQDKQQQQQNQNTYSPVNQQQILEPNEDTDMLKIKLQYMTKKQKNLHKKMVKGLVQESKVFNKKFQMMSKLDELVEHNAGNKTVTKMTFPKLIAKLRVQEQSKMRSTKSRNQSFMF